VTQIPLSLFTPAPFSDDETSRSAAKRIVPHLARLENLVLEAIRAAGDAGLCDHELEKCTGLQHQTASARRRELVIRGLIEDSGLRRDTPSGRSAKAWRVKK
jgi:hypothetical protein